MNLRLRQKTRLCRFGKKIDFAILTRNPYFIILMNGSANGHATNQCMPSGTTKYSRISTSNSFDSSLIKSLTVILG